MFAKILNAIVEYLQSILSLDVRSVNPVTTKPLDPIPLEQKNVQTQNSKLLYEVSKECLGRKMVPSGYDPILGCAISLNKVHEKAFGSQIGGDSSTALLWAKLRTRSDFEEVPECLPGDILISPTGTGTGSIQHGHVGIVGNNRIMSNDSDTGLWAQDFTLASWKKYFVDRGGYPMLFYRKQ